MSQARHQLADLQGGARVFWLLDLAYAGGIIRLSDGDVEIVDNDGASFRYFPGLDSVSMVEALELLSDMSTSPATASISAWMPVDVPRLSALGHDLGSATGTLYRWIEGTTLDKRRIIMRGTVTDPEYDSFRTPDEVAGLRAAAGSPARFSLTANVWQDTTTIPGAALSVLAANWDDAQILSLASEDFNLAYPIVVGRPGVVSTSLAAAGWCTATRPVWVDKRKTLRTANNLSGLAVVLAGHHVTASEVRANTDTYTGGERFVVHNTFDRNGHPVAIIPYWTAKGAGDDPFDWSGAGGYTWGGAPPYGLGVVALDGSFQPASNTAANIYAGWLDSASGGGGLAKSDGTTMELAGDVLEWLFTLTSIPVDHGRCAVATQLLQGFTLGFAIAAGVQPWTWAREHLLPILPVTVVSGPNGLYPIVWRYWATAADATIRIDAGTDLLIQRASSMKVDRSKIVNDFSLDYGYTIRTGVYRGRARLGAEGIDTGYPSYHCTISQGRYKNAAGDALVVEEQLQTAAVYDDATALAILQWRSLAYALARRRISYRVPESRYGTIERGQVATLTDPEMYLKDQVALVESVTTDGSAYLEIGFLIIEDPARDQLLGNLSA